MGRANNERRKRKFGQRVSPKAQREIAAGGPMQNGWSGCAKITYADKGAAKLALKELVAKRRHQREAGVLEPGKGCEQDVYRCPACRGWHLTHWQQGGPGGQVLRRRRRDAHDPGSRM